MLSIDPIKIHDAANIAWAFLDRGGYVRDAGQCHRFLRDEIYRMASQGVSHRLLLSNKAISAYLRNGSRLS